MTLLEEAESYRPALYSMARRLVQDAQEADAAVNTAIHDVLRAPASNVPCSTRTRLYRALRNACNNVLRSRIRRQRVITLVADLPANVAATNSRDPYKASDDARSLEMAMATLPAELQAIVREHFWGGKTYRELAEQFGIARGTVGNRIKEALALLKGTL